MTWKKIAFFWFTLVGLGIWACTHAHAENIVWQTGGLSVQLPDSGTDILPLGGYDVRFKQGIVGASSTFLDIYKIVGFDLGAVAAFPAQNNGQPYMGLSADLKKFIPSLAALTALKLQAATRYNTDIGG